MIPEEQMPGQMTSSTPPSTSAPAPGGPHSSRFPFVSSWLQSVGATFDDNAPSYGAAFDDKAPSYGAAFDGDVPSYTNSRSSLPKMCELQLMNPPIDYQTPTVQELSRIDQDPRHPLYAMRDTLSEFNALKNGIGILPASMKASLKEKLDVGGECRGELLLGCESTFDSSSVRLSRGDAPDLQRVQSVVEETLECMEDGDLEISWNERVHFRVLNVALRFVASKDELRYTNVTEKRDRIFPSFLLPFRRTSIQKDATIDYTINLLPSEGLNVAFRCIQPLANETTASFNHTKLSPKNSPIAISINTKSVAGDGEMNRVQLAVWAAALFERLKLLVKEAAHIPKDSSADIEIPPLPLVAVHGKTGALLVATYSAETDEPYKMWECGDFGSTDTIHGTYQVVAVLHLLMHWAQNSYRPWFESRAAPRPMDN
ncbi:hypothetical protein NA57DRAFT_76300 [Rhizodiscina lignyota]|uniref:PD-(D/E)XK nuclease-like domain-containing protein n=1 Tax=Rhizodiscina lignyota TaxID=1504668 RepID=A0A9P4IH42_9PEZI|nr:hypothetical protein NA57DRAFT_76300 [Rhizodiscina lignyota]